MANVYVRSAAAGTGTGADWTNAFTTLAAAFTAKAAGDNFFVSEDHAETGTAANTMTSPGTAASPCFVYCVNHAGSVPPVSADLRTTAAITTTSTGDIAFTGSAYFYGLNVTCGTTGGRTLSLGVSNTIFQSWKNCTLAFGSSGNCTLPIGQNGTTANRIDWDNVTVTFLSTGSKMAVQECRFTWRNTATAIGGATFPTTLLASNSPVGGYILLEGVDLSALGSGKTIVGAITAPQSYLLKDCKFGASVTVAAALFDPGGAETVVTRSDSAATNYRSEKYTYAGTETTETTIVRTGGASDGTTTVAKKIVTTATSKWVLPFEAVPIAIWNDTSGSSVTVTLFGIWGGGAVPNNDDIWFDLEYLGSATTPQGSFATASKADNLATGSALTSDTSTWGGSTTKFKMAITVTPQQKGAMYLYVKAAAASQTFYIDPKPVLS